MSTTHSTPKDSTDGHINSVDEVREGVVSEIADALLGDRPVLLDALPATGKSHGLVKAIQRTDEPVIILTQRGREEQYDQYERWCNSLELSYKTLPAPEETCPIFRGDHGEKERQRVRDLRSAGASPRHIHERLDLLCQASGPCPYEDAVNFDSDDHDVLVGHPYHAYFDEYLHGRVPVFDEFPGEAYLTEVGNVAEVVSSFLQDRNVPFRDYTDLLEKRDSESRRRNALERLQQLSLIDEQYLFENTHGQRHKLAGLCVLTLLESDDLDNGWESAILGEGRVGAFNRDEGTVHILNPPDLPEHILGLDGTPTKPMWELALGVYDRRTRLDLQRVLDDKEREQYMTEIQNLQIIPTTTNVRPYSGGNTYPKRDAAVVYEVLQHHAGKKGVISSKRGLRDLERESNLVSDRETSYYGNLLGSNGLSDVDVGVILGSPHYGDPWVKKWASLAGIAAESNDEGGLDKSYGEFGDEVLQHMREHRVLQALFRFARQGEGATVYVDTVALPDWVPVVAAPDATDINTRSPAELHIIESLKRLDEGRTREIAEEAGHASRTVRSVFDDLPNDIVSERRAEDGRGGAKVWGDEDLDALNPYGHVDLPNVGPPTRFSEQSPYRGDNGIVPKKPIRELSVQREREEQAKFKCRQHRQIQQMEMERLYGSG